MHKKKYVYHMTDIRNLSSIFQKGLLPTNCKRFGSLSPELKGNKKEKIFFCPTINGIGMKGFIQEWWHGEIEDIILLRIKCDNIKGLTQSEERYYARQECWSFNKVPASCIEVNTNLRKKPYEWVSLKDYLSEFVEYT